MLQGGVFCGFFGKIVAGAGEFGQSGGDRSSDFSVEAGSGGEIACFCASQLYAVILPNSHTNVLFVINMFYFGIVM